MLEYFTELANEGFIKWSDSLDTPAPELFDSIEGLHLGYYDLINFYFKDGYPVGFSDESLLLKIQKLIVAITPVIGHIVFIETGNIPYH